MTHDPLACRECGHPIEDHHPSEYGRDACIGSGYRKPWGVVCPCSGFTLPAAGTARDAHGQPWPTVLT